METNEIVKLILSDNKELSKSTRFYKLSLDEQVNVIISQRPELKNCFIADVVGRSEQLRTCKYCGSDDIVVHQLTGFQSACNSCRA